MPPILLLPFLLLAVAVLPSADAYKTYWKFNGTISCPKPFRAHFLISELDVFDDDEIATHPFILYSPKSYEVEGFDTDDGWEWPWLTPLYEIEMYIVHDCTAGTRKRKVKHYWGEYVVYDATYYGTKNFDLWEAGEFTTDINRKSAKINQRLGIEGSDGN